MPQLRQFFASLIGLILLVVVSANALAQKSYILNSEDNREHDGIEIINVQSGKEPFEFRFTVSNSSYLITNTGLYRDTPSRSKRASILHDDRFVNPNLVPYSNHGSSNYNFHGKIEKVKSYSGRAESLDFIGATTSFTSIHDSFYELNSTLSVFSFFYMEYDSVRNIRFHGDSLHSYMVQNSMLGRLLFDRCVISYFDVKTTAQPDTLEFYLLAVPESGSIDLTGFINKTGKEAALSVDIESLSKLKLNYINYYLTFFNYKYDFKENHQQEISFKQTLYTALIEMQKRYGFTGGEEKAVKEYKAFEYTKNKNWSGYAFNWLDKTWWDYSYNKGLIFKNTLFLMLFFYLINLFIYKKLIRKTYPLEEFVVNDRDTAKPSFKSISRYALYCLFYTGYVFFGLKLDFGTLKLRHLGYAAYIIIQSATGLICLAYIANYIITK